MRPLAVITGVLMASSGAIAMGLAVVVLIYLIIGTDEPQVRREIPTLLLNSAIFLCYTALAVAAFYAQVKAKSWAPTAVAVMVAALAALVWYYLP